MDIRSHQIERTVSARPSLPPLATLPTLGVGLGYRAELHDAIAANADKIDFLELISEQFMRRTPDALARALALSEQFPVIPHGVELSVGTAAGVDGLYLDELSGFVALTNAPWFSDHLAFTKVPGTEISQLTQLWFTQESLDVVCRNVRQVKARIQAPFLLENITYYFRLPNAEMSEAEFIARVLDQTDCGMLLDINNVHINSMNLGFDPFEFIESLPLERVVQIHLAGGVRSGSLVVDTHSTAVREEVWKLLEFVLDRASVKGIILEWDQDFPPFDVLTQHLERARSMMPAKG